jgi:predicted TIM-barrel fold metal-dependent hydrolase
MMIWTNSGDAHVLEPDYLWKDRLPAELAERMPRSERLDERTEVVHIDGQSFERKVGLNPVLTEEALEAAGRKVEEGSPFGQAGLTFGEAMGFNRPPGAWDVQQRLRDLDGEGVWGEVVYPSIGLWNGLIKDPVLYREGVRVLNDWLKEEFIDVTPRSVPAAEISILDVDDAINETIRAAEMGFKVMSLPSELDRGEKNWNDDKWEPLWRTLDETGMVLGIHIGSAAKVPGGQGNRVFHGPGGAVLNYVESGYDGQRAATMLVTGGALDRHPNLKVLISEGGATWVPFVADRMDEGYRQHGIFVRPKLSRLPSEILFSQVYASFQHDKSAVKAYTALGYKNVLFGSDYPHMEGTFGHTQKTLHELFDDEAPEVRERITKGAFLELFPSVGEPPTAFGDE